MNFYEERIQSLQKRIKRIEEQPEPTMLRTNKLFRSMGFTPSWRSISGMQTIGTGALKYFDVLRAKGFSTNCCDMASIPLAMTVSGDMSPESFVISTFGSCNPMGLRHLAEEHMLGTPTFHFDVGLEDNKDCLQYMTNQLGDLIEFLEWKIPGVKYDEDRLIEWQGINQAFFDCYKESYQMLKHLPSPISGKDVFRIPRPPAEYPDPDKVLAFLKARRDEIGERVEKGIGAMPDEKLRILWAVTEPYFMDPFEILEKRGCSVTFWYGGLPLALGSPIPQPTYSSGKKLTPLEVESTMAISWSKTSWGGLGSRWVDGIICVCKDLKIDAIVYYCMMGCGATLGLKKLVADAAEKELGIPTLQLEGRQLEITSADKEVIETKLGEFIDMCLALKRV